MIYLLLNEKKEDILTIKGENFKYLVKVRRHSVGDSIDIRYKENITELCHYKITDIEGRFLTLELQSSEILEVKASKELHIGWCKIDAKSVEKMLPSLSEIGVSKISFIDCERSQRNNKLDIKRLERIVESSMQQCGRTSTIEFDSYKTIESFIEKFPQTKVFDFTEKTLGCDADFDTVLIGCEGGFSPKEKEFLSSLEVFRLNTPLILRSESAVFAVASKLLV